jgi:cytosine/adenosine deaminase-related metal-dependent hydrolase
MHTHLCETLDEEDYCLALHKKRPLEYMESVGWLEGGRSWFAHCVHMSGAESRKLARTRTGVAHCPSSNLRLGSGIAPVRMYLKDKVPVGLGVDGSASNDSSVMLAEARQAMLVARVKSGVASMPARDALWLATRGGAEVLGRDDIGQLAPGKAADLALFDVSGIDFAGALSDPVAAVLFCGASHKAKHVVVNGELVVEHGRLVRVEEPKLARRANALSKRLVDG